MRIFFDVDATIISWDGRVRPGTREIFAQLTDRGHTVYVWSGVGLRWNVVEEHGLRPYVKDCYVKPPTEKFNNLGSVGIDVTPDFVVDDYPEVTEFFGGVTVKPYIVADPDDRELARVYDRITRSPTGKGPT